MKQQYIIPAALVLLLLILGLGYCRQQKDVRKVLAENERLHNENRDLRRSLDQSGRVAQQISDRKDIQQRVNAQFVDRRVYFRQNWQQFITVSLSDYRTGLLGGIKDLSIIVRNQTDYPLENAVVTLQYLRNNDEVFKTEEYAIKNIPAQGQQTLQASNSRKGSKASVKLLSITSQAMNFCWSVNKKVAPGTPDPYACVPSAPVPQNQ
ncbi:hypothetical protein [Chitinophaga sp. sic0106]|uniref:hypothetical protein n=1 Tax=Chitinophaga sp. sic0106 TaxID=2854785 RepID=UPI001C44FBDD|nr:hypothetical protein [Chitinophaga sp. sic0106]MBV7532298.1 hypothetical protein [Chitinophaga sp. sic0106]